MIWSKDSVSQKKKFLSSMLKRPLLSLAQNSIDSWQNSEALTNLLQQDLCKLPHCQLLYAINTQGQQISANITRNGVDHTWCGQDLSARPYLNANLPYKGLVLSAAYLSQRSMQPCITAVQAVQQDGQLIGFIAADFHIKDLPSSSGTTLQSMQRQNQRDYLPEPRGHSQIDENINYLIFVLSVLMQEHGIFHCQLHFDSDQCMLYSNNDPYRYQLFNVSELMDPELSLLYPKQSYDSRNTIEKEKIPHIFAQLKALREADDAIYLRSGSLNLINGMVNLTFSSDGTNYVSVDEFINHELAHWFDHHPATQMAVNMENTTPN